MWKACSGGCAFNVFAYIGLKKITLEEGLKVIGSRVFENMSLTEIENPASVVVIYENVFKECQLTKIRFRGKIPLFMDGGAFGGIKGTSIIKIPEHVCQYEWETVREAGAGQDGLERYLCKLCGDVQATLVISAAQYQVQELYTKVTGAAAGETVTYANLKYKFGNRHFWSEGYYVSTVGLNEATIKKYIQDQEKYDIMQDKLSVKEYKDPFKG